MKDKHIVMRMEQAVALARLSPCGRRKYGCVIVDPIHNVIISEGFNGGLRGAPGTLCDGDKCAREGVPSGTHYEVGCVHSEFNAIANAARVGRSVAGAWLFVTGCPCQGCARAIVQAGISRVVAIDNGYAGQNGYDILINNGVDVTFVTVPESPLKALCTRLEGLAEGHRTKATKAPDGWIKWQHEDSAALIDTLVKPIKELLDDRGGLGPEKDPGGR